MHTPTAFILAGGRSSRMGSDKALLSWGEQTLLERALRIASETTLTVRIVGPRVRYARFGAVVEDIHQGCGPLGGIHAALTATATELNLILSVDMPLMSSRFLEWLIRQAGNGQQLITVPDADGGQQPLCAVYRKAVIASIEESLKNAQYKIGRLFAQVPTRVITEEEITVAGFSPAIFRNVNTPEEFAQLVSTGSVTTAPGEKRPR